MGTLGIDGTIAVTFAPLSSLQIDSVLQRGTVLIGNSSTITNRSGHTWTVASPSGPSTAIGVVGSGKLINAGNFVVSGTASLAAPFVNAGSVSVRTGTLIFSRAITNSGSISSSGAAIYLAPGGSATNNTSGRISGTSEGIYAKGAPTTLINSGGVTAASGAGVSLTAGGLVTNKASGIIVGSTTGVGATGVAATIVNGGSISGAGNGIYLGAGGVVTNAAGAHINGTQKNGVSLKGPGSLNNSGSIHGTVGVFFAAGGSVTNAGKAAISGGVTGVLIGGGNVTVTNAGTISGSTYAIDFKGSGTDTLIVDPARCSRAR